MDVEPPARSPCSTCTAWVVLCLPAVCEKLDDCLRKLFLRQRVVLGNDRTDQNSKFDRSMICHDLAMIWPSSGHILMLFPVDYSPTWRLLRPPAPSVSPELTPEASARCAGPSERILGRSFIVQNLYWSRFFCDLLYQNVN